MKALSRTTSNHLACVAPTLVVLTLGAPTGVLASDEPLMFESAALGAVEEVDGLAVDPTHWWGVAFTIEASAHITTLGAHIGGTGTVFFALLPVEDRVPANPVGLDRAVFVRTIEVREPSMDEQVDVDIALPAGQWAFVVGTGAAGADGVAFLPNNNPNLGDPVYFRTTNQRWWPTSYGGIRVVVSGDYAQLPPTEPVCGDSIVDEGQACDDGNVSNRDGCLNNCRLPFCGDGYMRSGVEQCDDGNHRDGDGCSADCTREVLTRESPATSTTATGICQVGVTRSGSVPFALFVLVVIAALSRRVSRQG